ncbi:hypothetical protein [Actinophytocola sp. NPDC049390]|uniref:hypothetical protein n=1 Tax=Actinophytocola sp. NPDC049390 TaxID=3363894 RepID=UPI00379F9666
MATPCRTKESSGVAALVATWRERTPDAPGLAHLAAHEPAFATLLGEHGRGTGQGFYEHGGVQ